MSVAVKKWTYREFREMEFDDNDRNTYEIINGITAAAGFRNRIENNF